MDLAEHLDDARLVETLTPALALREPAQVERFGARQREYVVVDGIVVREIDRRADRDRDNARDEVFVPLTDLGAHYRSRRPRRVLEIHDDMTQLGFRSQGHCWYIAGVR